MNILLVEDDIVSWRNALQALSEQGYKATVVSTVFDFLATGQALDSSQSYRFNFDAVITEIYIPVGDMSKYSVSDHYAKENVVSAGLIVALAALVCNIPCLIFSDANIHEDIFDLLLSRIPRQKLEEVPKLSCITCAPRSIVNGGKDYKLAVTWLNQLSKTKRS